MTIDPGQQLLDTIASLEVQRARIEAEIASTMVEFADLRRREAERHEDRMLRDLEADFAADELSLVLKEPTRTVQCRLAESRRVRWRLPLTWQAFGAGRIDDRRMRQIASAVDKLSDNYATIELDYWVVEYASTHTTSQLRAWLRRFVARNAPDQHAARAEHDKRSVWLCHQDDGMSFLSAYIPTPAAIRLDAELTRLAKAEPSDGRTLDQKRADAFARGMLGDGSSAQAIIGVLVPVTSLAGLDHEPGTSFDGQFALPASMVRDLAAEPGTLFHRVFTDPLGHILDITELGRFPSRKLRWPSTFATAPAGSPPVHVRPQSATTTTLFRTRAVRPAARTSVRSAVGTIASRRISMSNRPSCRCAASTSSSRLSSPDPFSPRDSRDARRWGN